MINKSTVVMRTKKRNSKQQEKHIIFSKQNCWKPQQQNDNLQETARNCSNCISAC